MTEEELTAIEGRFKALRSQIGSEDKNGNWLVGFDPESEDALRLVAEVRRLRRHQIDIDGMKRAAHAAMCFGIALRKIDLASLGDD